MCFSSVTCVAGGKGDEGEGCVFCLRGEGCEGGLTDCADGGEFHRFLVAVVDESLQRGFSKSVAGAYDFSFLGGAVDAADFGAVEFIVCGELCGDEFSCSQICRSWTSSIMKCAELFHQFVECVDTYTLIAT